MKYPVVDDISILLEIVSDIRSIRGQGQGRHSIGDMNVNGGDIGTGGGALLRAVRGVPNDIDNDHRLHDYESMNDSNKSWLPTDMLMTPLENIGSLGRR